MPVTSPLFLRYLLGIIIMLAGVVAPLGFAASRTLRIADGPDEVHLGTIAKLEMQGKARL